jgi:hypothetical protein
MEVCRPDPARFQGLLAELDALSERSGALAAIRCERADNGNVEGLCMRISEACASSQRLVDTVGLIQQCLDVTAHTVSVDLRLKIEGCEALQQVKAVLAASQSISPGDWTEVQHCLNAVVMALRSGVFTRLVDAESLTGGVDTFERFLTASCTGMSSMTDCLCSLVMQAVSLMADASAGPAADTLRCVADWVEALVALGGSVVSASKEAPNELRSGMVLTKVWKEIARLLQAIPADLRDGLAECTFAAFTAAWNELQARC